MKKGFIIVTFLITTILLSSFITKALNDDELTTNYYAPYAITNSEALENNETLLTLPDDVSKSRVIHGDNVNDYFVDLTNLTLKIKPLELEQTGRFTISFLGSRENQPLVSGSEGISFVFRMISGGTQLEIAILDAKTGELIDEMKGVQWAYLGSPETNWDNGVIGILHGQNGQVVNSEMTLKFQTDSASSGGTTFRPSMGSSLGVAIPLSLFTARDLDITSLVMMISSGEKLTNYNFEDGSHSTELNGNDLVFKILSLEDTNTRKYRQNPTRVELIDQITDYVTKSNQLKQGLLSVEEYATIIEKTFDLSALRSEDRTIQKKRVITAKAVVDETISHINQLKTYAQNYALKINALADLSTITEENINEAKLAKETYDAAAIYKQYLSSSDQQEIDNIVNAIKEVYILRAELNMALTNFEDAVGLFSEDINNADPTHIIEAIKLRNLVDITLFDNLDESDATNFTTRYNTANNILTQALDIHLFVVEKQRIIEYQNQFETLTITSTNEALYSTIEMRPTIDLSSFNETEKAEITTLLNNVDTAFKNLLLDIVLNAVNQYTEKVNDLIDRKELTQTKIDDAKQAKYDSDLIATIIEISEVLELDISNQIENLYENDRLVDVGVLFLDLNHYYQAVLNINEVGHLSLAYALHNPALNNIHSSIFNVEESNEYDIFFNETSEAMNTAAKMYIDPAIELLETEMEKDLSITIQMNKVKHALSLIPNLEFLTIESDYIIYQTRLNNLMATLREEDLYYFSTDEASSWYAQSVEAGVLLTGTNNQGIMNLQEPLSIDGLDMVFDYTKIGRIWAGEVDGKYPQNILVLNFMREYGKIKDQSQGFSIYLNPNVLDELEVMIYGPDRDGQNIMLAQGKLSNQVFDDEDNPYQIRIRISKESAPLNSYQIWINSLKLNVYYRDIINFPEENSLHIPDFEAGSEIGENIFLNDKAHVSFVLFGQDLTDDEKTSAITIKMLNDKTFAGYIAPLLPVEMIIEKEPNKMEYFKGEALDLTGLVVKIIMSDGSSKIIDNALLQVGGFTSSSTGNKIVSLIYTEEDITLTKVIRVKVLDTQDEKPKQNNIGLIIGITAGAVALTAIGLSVTFVLRKKLKR